MAITKSVYLLSVQSWTYLFNVQSKETSRWLSINLEAYFSHRFLVSQGTPQYLNDQSETEVPSNFGELNSRHQFTFTIRYL